MVMEDIWAGSTKGEEMGNEIEVVGGVGEVEIGNKGRVLIVW